MNSGSSLRVHALDAAVIKAMKSTGEDGLTPIPCVYLVGHKDGADAPNRHPLAHVSGFGVP